MCPPLWQIVLLLRLVPMLPFSVLNYLLSVTPVALGEYMLASWLGMVVCILMFYIEELHKVSTFYVIYTLYHLRQPITLALVYAGTTLKDLSDVTHGWHEFSKTRWVRCDIICHIFLGKDYSHMNLRIIGA